MKIKALGVVLLASSMALAGCANTGTTGNGTGFGGANVNKAVIGAVAGALGGTAISKATGGEKQVVMPFWGRQLVQQQGRIWSVKQSRLSNKCKERA